MINNVERTSPLEISPKDFRTLGHRLIDDIAEFLESLRRRPVNPAETPHNVRTVIGDRPVPGAGAKVGELLSESTRTLFDHSLFNGHPAFFGYITSSAAPIGALGDLLAASVNPNVGSFQLAPVATEIEAQTIRWIAEMIGYPTDCGGIMVSGGNMANLVCFLAGRKAQSDWNIREQGISGAMGRKMRIYASKETHTWIKKAADMFGFGTDAIRWIATDGALRMSMNALERQIQEDRAAGEVPFMVIGAAGSVSTGAVDPLRAIADVCARHDLWFHVDGAYGGFGALLPDAPEDLKHLSLADSIAVDPHKWLYAPLEAGCALVKDGKVLHDAFSFHASYYRFEGSGDEPPLNYFEYGPQNSRGFRALKVWLAIQQAGLDGVREMIADDCLLAKELFDEVRKYPDLEAMTYGLSIATFRYVPGGIKAGTEEGEKYLNELNEAILKGIQESGEAYLSNAIINGAFALRACIVNFRTTRKEIRALPALAVKIGKKLDGEMRETVR